MSLRNLVQRFAGQASPPIILEDIREWLINTGFSDHIWFVAEPEFDGLIGQFIQQRMQPAVYASEETLVDVFYAENLDDKGRRIVCCKELLHIFDSEEQKTFLPEHVERLTAALVTHGTSDELIHQISSEYAAFFNALAVLVPLALFEKFQTEYPGSTPEVLAALSDRFQIPIELGLLVLMPGYKIYAQSLLK